MPLAGRRIDMIKERMKNLVAAIAGLVRSLPKLPSMKRMTIEDRERMAKAESKRARLAAKRGAA